ncbi:MAG: helix-turn-helix domain-containing protein, partial [Candidatus Lokiarchaeota archaeon]|nr:helix-turn-helix domain-containing protein [Candidatus Lokiarchaeota archaeon]
MLLTKKLRICPSSEQAHVLWNLSEKCRFLYNFSLQERKEDWKLQQQKPKDDRNYTNYLKQSKTLPSIKQKYP